MNRALFLYATAFAILAGVPFAGATSFSYIGFADIQEYSVTTTGEYYLSATGGQGGGADNESPFGVGGYGASVNGYFNLTAGEQLDVVVGGQGSTGQYDGDGGSGTFIFICAAADCLSNQADDTLLLAAGGGGGAGSAYESLPPNLWTTYPGDGGGAAGESGSGAGGGADGYGGSQGASGGGVGGGGWNNFAFGGGGPGHTAVVYFYIPGVGEVPLDFLGGGGGGGGYSGGGGGGASGAGLGGGGGGGDYDAGLNPGYAYTGTGDGSAEIDLFMAATPPTPIPEPSSPSLLALGTVVLLAVRRRAARQPLLTRAPWESIPRVILHFLFNQRA